MSSPSSTGGPSANATGPIDAVSVPTDLDPPVEAGAVHVSPVAGARLGGLLGRHAGFVTVFAAGLVLRVLVLVAYPQAFFYTDSMRYLLYSYSWHPDFARQAGYSLVLKVLRHVGPLYTVSVLQHLLGLAMAVGVYALLQRRSVPRWLAVLAVTPLLLDALELSIEHYVLADTVFTTLIVGGLLALLWSRRLNVWAAGLAGLLLAVSATVRVVSLPLVIITVVYIVLRRAGWRATLAYATCAALPLLGYLAWFHHSHGRYTFSTNQGAFLYGRVAPFADCEKLELTPAQRKICPTEPIGVRHPRADWYIFNEASPIHNTDTDLQNEFARAVFTQQPLDAAFAITRDTAKYLIPNATKPEWVCLETVYVLPAEPPGPEYEWCKPNPRQAFTSPGNATNMTGNTATMPTASSLTSFLGAYADFARTPRLVLGFSVLFVLLALMWRPRRKVGRNVTTDVLVIAVWGLGLLVLGVAGSMFDERYGVPSLAILPVAGALALHRLLQSRRGEMGRQA